MFVSAEMSKIDVANMARRFPVYGEIPTWFPDFRTNDPMGTFEDLCQQGFDFVVVDSLAQFQELCSMNSGLSKKKTLVRFFTAVKNAMEGVQTDSGERKHTSFGVIQQVNKSGEMAGAKYIEHTATSLLEVRKSSGDGRFIRFGKNRRGGVTAKLHFELGEDNIYFDEDRLDRHMSASDLADKERERAREQREKAKSIEGALGNDDEDFDGIESLLGGTGSVEPADFRVEAADPVSMDRVTHDALDEAVDTEMALLYFEENDGTVKRAREQMIEDGHWPSGGSRYYFERFLARHDISDKDESDIN
jgi:hypothetical protein